VPNLAIYSKKKTLGISSLTVGFKASNNVEKAPMLMNNEFIQTNGNHKKLNPNENNPEVRSLLNENRRQFRFNSLYFVI
jgi:hypothetical protein